MLALIKASLLLGAVLLVGAGIFGRFVAPELRPCREVKVRLRLGMVVGAAVLLMGSVLDVTQTLLNVMGRYDAALLWEYLRFTRHGNATLVRLLLVLAVLLMSLRWVNRASSNPTAPFYRATHAAYTLLSLGLLVTFSWTSHAAAMGGTLPLLADLAHFSAASAWPGAVFYLALVPVWRSAEQCSCLTKALTRVSALGLVCVALLFLTGAYTSLIHLQNPERFAASPYGQALLYKLLLVGVIVGLAAYNRVWLLPAFLRRDFSGRFQRVLRLEALALIVVFILTGLLTTSALPHEPGLQSTAFDNFQTLLRYLGATFKGAL